MKVDLENHKHEAESQKKDILRANQGSTQVQYIVECLVSLY